MFEGCPGAQPTIDLVRRIVEGRADVEVQTIVVADARAARKCAFLGSPSVRVDGVDVDPDAAQATIAFSCRVYVVEGRVQSTPPREWIERSLQ